MQIIGRLRLHRHCHHPVKLTRPPIRHVAIRKWKRRKKGVSGMVKSEITFDGEGNSRCILLRWTHIQGWEHCKAMVRHIQMIMSAVTTVAQASPNPRNRERVEIKNGGIIASHQPSVLYFVPLYGSFAK